MLVEEAAGTSVFEEAYEEARRRVGVAKTTLEDKLRDYVTIDSCLRSENNRLVEANKDSEAWEKEREARKTEAQLAARKLRDEAAYITGEVSGLPERLKQSIDELNKKIDSVSSEIENERKLYDLEVKADRALAESKSLLSAEERKVASINREIATIEHKVGCPCGECGRPISPVEIAPVKLLLEEKLRYATEEFNKRNRYYEDDLKRAESAREAVKAHRATMTDVKDASIKRTALQKDLDEVLKRIGLRDMKLTLAIAARDRFISINNEINPFITNVERCKKSISVLSNNLSDLGDKVKEAEVALRRATNVAEIFSPSGVRAHILDTVTPFLNSQTAKYLSVLSDGNISATWSTLSKTAKGEFREKFAVEVSSITGGDSFGLISGGEKRKVRIATTLALQDLVASRATKPIELFIGDEIDDALDIAGLERLMMILEEKARDRGTVLIVSHNDLNDWISNSITVTKKDGASTIEENIT
jgi:DNA repair exonuclease SbcCD ATPase subunit